MAMASACKLQVGRDHHDGKVRMEADHIDFSGSTKFRFRLAEIRSARQDGDSILFDFHGNPVCIKLPSAKTAAGWIDYVLHPQTLADKLGVREGDTVRMMNLDDAGLITQLENKKTKVVFRPTDRCNLVMLAVERPSELRQMEYICESLVPEGAIWVILQKSARTVTKANVDAAAREAGLKQVGAIDFSETQAAYKVVRQVDGRQPAPAVSNGARRPQDVRGLPPPRGNSRRAAVRAK